MLEPKKSRSILKDGNAIEVLSKLDDTSLSSISYANINILFNNSKSMIELLISSEKERFIKVLASSFETLMCLDNFKLLLQELKNKSSLKTLVEEFENTDFGLLRKKGIILEIEKDEVNHGYSEEDMQTFGSGSLFA